MEHGDPFVFCTERRLVALTGLKARTLAELVTHLYQVSGSSIFYHTHQQFLSHHFERHVFTNDFACWVSRALLEERLAERLAAIDLLSFTTIRQLREEIVRVIESHLRESPGRQRECPLGDEFHFCKSKSFIMRTGVVVRNIEEFAAGLARVSNTSVFFHFIEARLRLERPTNDFSAWLHAAGEEEAAAAIDALDPYLMTLDELKAEIVRAARRHRRRQP